MLRDDTYAARRELEEDEEFQASKKRAEEKKRIQREKSDKD